MEIAVYIVKVGFKLYQSIVEKMIVTHGICAGIVPIDLHQNMWR